MDLLSFATHSNAKTYLGLGRIRYELSGINLANEADGADALRVNGVKLVVAGDDFAAELLGEGEAEAVTEGEGESNFVLADLLPKRFAHFFV